MAAVVDAFPRTPVVRRGVFIPLSDGTRLAVRIWLPDDAEADPVPAVLEYLPYRLNDGTASGDHRQMTWFAGHGIAGVRVDIRGTGDSDGVCPDEYTEREQLDCLEVIAWIAAQPWCTGAVGMMGYSWGGFNSLQVAARRPPALKAIATCYASDDRYADDVHYRGGLVEPMDMLHWSVCMHGWQARPPDPEVAGEGWRAMWRDRLELEPWVASWMAHQRRDAYWRQGSVRDDYDAIACPVLAIAGWTDGYRDAALRLMEGLHVPRRAIIGPWGHNDPVHGAPGPAVGILSELVRWWNRWLRGVDSGIDGDPTVIAYIQDPVPPAANVVERPGRWVGEPTWPSPRIVTRAVAVPAGTVASRQTTGLDGGAWCADGRSADLPLDQRVDEAYSLVTTGAPLTAPLEILGMPVARLLVSADRPVALVSVRLSEVAADGSSLLVTRGQLNLCHHRSHAEPERLVPGEVYDVAVPLDAIGHRFAEGSRLRVAISPCYWPLAWPSPEEVTLTVHGGALELPVREAPADEELPRPLDPPAEPPPLAVDRLAPGSGGGRTITRNLASGRTDLVFDWDCGGRTRLANGIVYEDTSVVTYSICDGDPLSARVEVVNTAVSGRGDWLVEIRATGVMTCTATEFETTSTLEVSEDGAPLFQRTWNHRFPRDHC
jgi:uncharacterized protein